MPKSAVSCYGRYIGHWPVKMAGYWPRSIFASLWTSTPSRSINIHKHANNELGQYPVILTLHLVNYPYIFFAPNGSHDLYNRSKPMSGKVVKHRHLLESLKQR